MTLEPSKALMEAYLSIDHKESLDFDRWYWKTPMVIKHFEKIGWPVGESLKIDLTDVQKVQVSGIALHLTQNKVLSDQNDDACMICGYDDYEENNKILYCDSCDISIHQNCYDLTDVKNVSLFDFKCWPCKVLKDKELTYGLKCKICG